MSRWLTLSAVMLLLAATIDAHDFGTSITWNREISRLVLDRCAACHREGGSSFSLMTYAEAQPRATEIKTAVLSRKMPPWGAVKGFGDFRNDTGLTQEQIELVAAWVEGGMRKGNNPRMLPEPPKEFPSQPAVGIPPGALTVRGDHTLATAFVVDGVVPENVRASSSMQVTARLPGGEVVPLVWLYEYSDRYRHAFLLRKPLMLPAGTVIRGIKPPARLVLLPAKGGRG